MPSATNAYMPQDIDRGRLEQLQARFAALVEVLPPEEFENEHLPGALNLPLEELGADAADRILGRDRQREVVVYCQAID
ncbi:MAG TPA: rhodanese-like domain-containing protein [Chloroflexota bacterium]|jgi:rhodanese-related sulfurtransferase